MTSETELAEGQVWRGSEHWFVIGRIDVFDGVRVISISAFKNAEMTEEFASHLPLSEQTFSGWAIELVGHDGLVSEHFEGGYDHWRTAFDTGEAGTW